MMRKNNYNLRLRRAHYPAFTLNELLISMMIVAIVGGAVIYALAIITKTFGQADDQTSASYEMEYVWKELSPQFTNIGLCMPNNSALSGSFNISFTGPATDQPIMAYMGDYTRADREWGCPVTVGKKGAHIAPTDSANMVRAKNSDGVYAGEELFYAWAVPTNERLSKTSDWATTIGSATSFSSNQISADITFKFYDGVDSVQKLANFTYNGRRIGISTTKRGANVSSWILLPSFKIPLLIDAIDTETVTVRISPYSYFDDSHTPRVDKVNFEGIMNGLEEVHLLQAACLFTENRRLIQRIYGNSINEFTDKVLGVNILGTYFVFDDERRLLTMYIAGSGNSPSAMPHSFNVDYLASRLPSFVPYNFIASDDQGFRIIVESITWRIRN